MWPSGKEGDLTEADEDINFQDSSAHSISFDHEDYSNADGPGPKRRKGGRYSRERSAIWDHFDFDPTEQKNKCRHCAFSTSDRHPGNLKKHLRKHPEAAAAVDKKMETKRPALAYIPSASSQSAWTTVSGSQSAANDTLDREYSEVESALALLFASNSLPSKMVESPEFIHFVSLLDPTFELPNRWRLRAYVSELENGIKGAVAMEIGDSKLCIMVDIWTPNCGRSPSYLAIMARFFHERSTSIKTALLAARELEETPTTNGIFTSVRSALAKWGISENRVLFYVTNNGSKMVKAFRQCLVKLDESLEIDQEELTIRPGSEDQPNQGQSQMQYTIDQLEEYQRAEREHFACFGYSKRIPSVAADLDCVVGGRLDQCPIWKSTLATTLRVVTAINASEANKIRLFEYNGRRLVIPSNLHWICVYDVLDGLVESMEMVNRMGDDVRLESPEWDHIKQVRDLLRPFAHAIRIFETDPETTISKVIPAIIDLMEGVSGPYLDELASTKVGLKVELEKRFSHFYESPSVLLLATFLDPEYTIGLTKKQREICVEAILNDLIKPAYDMATDLSGKLFQGFFKRAQLVSTAGSSEFNDTVKNAKMNLEIYIEHVQRSALTIKSNTISPVEFWATKREAFGDVAVYALNLFAIPTSSSGGMKRVFSKTSLGPIRNIETELIIKVNREFFIKNE